MKKNKSLLLLLTLPLLAGCGGTFNTKTVEEIAEYVNKYDATAGKYSKAKGILSGHYFTVKYNNVNVVNENINTIYRPSIHNKIVEKANTDIKQEGDVFTFNITKGEKPLFDKLEVLNKEDFSNWNMGDGKDIELKYKASYLNEEVNVNLAQLIRDKKVSFTHTVTSDNQSIVPQYEGEKLSFKEVGVGTSTFTIGYKAKGVHDVTVIKAVGENNPTIANPTGAKSVKDALDIAKDLQDNTSSEEFFFLGNVLKDPDQTTGEFTLQADGRSIDVKGTKAAWDTLTKKYAKGNVVLIKAKVNKLVTDGITTTTLINPTFYEMKEGDVDINIAYTQEVSVGALESRGRSFYTRAPIFIDPENFYLKNKDDIVLDDCIYQMIKDRVVDPNGSAATFEVDFLEDGGIRFYATNTTLLMYFYYSSVEEPGEAVRPIARWDVSYTYNAEGYLAEETIKTHSDKLSYNKSVDVKATYSYEE